MRIRAFVAATVLGVGLFAAPAAAQEEFPDHDTEECFEIIEGGGSVDECHEAPSPILPATNEVIWGVVSFVVLLALLWKFAYPGIRKGMDARTERIRESLESADTAKTEAQTVLDEYRSQLADARSEAGRIIEEARQQADALRRDQEGRLQAELAEMRQRAAADIDAAKAQAIADLRAEVADIAIGAAQVVVQRNLDRDTQLQLIENYINQVASSR
jgi:F-type H+-transporting ATPase subunit b